VSVLFGDWLNSWCRGMELVLFKKLCCFCHHSKKAGGQLQLHLGLMSHSTSSVFSRICKVWDINYWQHIAHIKEWRTISVKDANLIHFMGLQFMQALVAMPAIVS